uniref:Facilitated trehalose transporter Tret1-2 homolog n=1 Tax=Cacopsylla melanoneura TaxID=428564 RepID=A0A8D8T401_9HEMI
MVQELNTSHLISNMTNTIILAPGTTTDKKKLTEEELIGRNSLRHLSSSTSSSSGSSISSSGQTHSYLKYLRAKRAFCAQCIMNAALIVLMTGYGMPIGFSGIVSPKLQAENSSLRIDQDTASWIVSVHSIATPIGAILAGPLMDEFGRKATLQFSIVPMVLGWVLISLTPNAMCLIIGRLLAGFAVGMGPAPSQILIGEISEPKLRGFFGSTPSASYALGILLVYGMSSMYDWRIVAALGAFLPVMAFVFLCFLPESPTWYINKNRIEEARASLIWLRGGDREKADEELQSLLMLSKTHNKMQRECPEGAQSLEALSFISLVKKCWRMFCRPEVKRPFSIIITFAILQIMSGSYIIIFYAVELVSAAAGSENQDLTVTIAVMTAFTRFLVSILVSILLFVMGRRTLGIISGIGTAIASLCIVVYLYCKQNNIWLWSTDLEMCHSMCSGVAIACLIMLYVAMNTLGIFSLPMLLMAETLPANVRGIVSGFTVMLVNIFIFGSTKMYPYTKNLFGPIGIFTWFSVVSIAIALYIYLYLPETKDRSLPEIEFYFRTGRNHLWITRDKAMYKRKKKGKCKHIEASNSNTQLT